MKLTKDALIKEAELFCARENSKKHQELVGINDGKSIGTFIEHEFKKYLQNKYEFNMGSSAQGIDFPDEHINTDLKVTSNKKPQNSCPFTDVRQKIYGLGYNLLLIIYSKHDENNNSTLKFESCTFIDKEETGDYILTKNLRKMVENKWDKEKIFYYLQECNLPCDDNTLDIITDEIIKNPPKQGYLTLSNAFQWRLKYNHKEKQEILHKFNKKEYGDYQTPLFFTKEVLHYCINKYEINPDVIIEPTCGIGNFIKALQDIFPEKSIIGIDINEEYVNDLQGTSDNIKVYHDNIFDYDFNQVIKAEYDEYMIVGNPPWITNTDLSKFKSSNIPKKNNIKEYGQFDAKTGMSNFDISENIILHIIEKFKNLKSTIVFLCKYNVACNIFEYLVKSHEYPARINIVKFDAMKIFRIDTSSCILLLQFNDENHEISSCMVNDLEDPNISYLIGIKDGKLYSNLDNNIEIDGECCFEWRQGIKHDCVKVMELTPKEGKYENKKNDIVELEEDLLYPLLKSSNLKKAIVNKSDKKILITQKKLREDTNYIEKYPLTWNYLTENKEYFDNRKSSIYNNAPDYSIFGIGDYAFKKYKVAISGFYKRGIFSLVYNDKYVMLDDTCYYLSFDDYDEAYITMLILNSDIVQQFLKNIVFLDSKRPYTKNVLKRIDIEKSLEYISLDDLIETERILEIDNYIDRDKFEDYVEKRGMNKIA